MQLEVDFDVEEAEEEEVEVLRQLGVWVINDGAMLENEWPNRPEGKRDRLHHV